MNEARTDKFWFVTSWLTENQTPKFKADLQSMNFAWAMVQHCVWLGKPELWPSLWLHRLLHNTDESELMKLREQKATLSVCDLPAISLNHSLKFGMHLNWTSDVQVLTFQPHSCFWINFREYSMMCEQVTLEMLTFLIPIQQIVVKRRNWHQWCLEGWNWLHLKKL